MRRAMWLTVACLLGGLMVIAMTSGLRTHVQAADVKPAPSLALLRATTANAGDVVINEVAWMGTAANSSDEWIELYNTTGSSIDIGNWSIYGADTGVCLNFYDADGSITTTVPAHGYLIYANESDNVNDPAGTSIVDIWDTSIGMNNSSPGQIILYDGPNCGGNTIDTANQNTGNWFAGDSGDTRTMERKDPTDSGTDGSNWATNDPNIAQNGFDANDADINGTPKARNSCYQSQAADLVIIKSGPANVETGSAITYYITLSNTGVVTATDVRVTDTLPAEVEFVAQTSSLTFTQPGGALVWDAGDVPTETHYTITVTGHVSDTATGSFTNHVTATTSASETVAANNSAAFTTTILPPVRIYALAPANYGGSEEAAALINYGAYTVSLDGWRLNDEPEVGGVSFPTTATIGAGRILWVAEDADGFYSVWGFDADWAATAITRPVPTLGMAWPYGLLSNEGDAIYLLDASDNVVDALAYGTGTASQSWQGSSVPYKYAGYGDGQVLYRKLAQSTGLPVPDTDTAADWAQDGADPINGRKLRYPGWDLEELFFPAEITATANITLAVAPEGTLDVVSQTIASAQHTLLIEAYTLKSVPLYEAINARIQAGVAVTILLESGPAGGGIDDTEKWIVEQLYPTATIYFIGATAPRYAYQHAKFILVDDDLALVSTDNFGESSMPSDRKDNGTMGHRGFVAVTDSPGVIARLADIFRRDCDPARHLDVAVYDGSFSPDTPLPEPDWTTYTAPFADPLATTADHITVLHAPENTLRDQDALLGLLGSAGNGDQIAVMQMAEPFTWTVGAGDAGLNPRLQALVAASWAGAQVRVLLDAYYDDPLAANGNTAACLRLNAIAAQESLNLACRLANVTGLGIHAKVFLVSKGGERWVHLGSINGGENSNKRNREVALQFCSSGAYNRMLQVFDYDWERGHGPMVHRVHLPLVMRDYFGPADYPLISEVFINPDGDETKEEWIEIYNPGDTTGIAGWTLGDAIDTGDYKDGRYAFPGGAQLAHDQVIVAAACATSFSTSYGKNPDYEWTNCDAAVPDLTPAGSWDGFGMAMGNTSDEAMLLNGSGVRVDSAAWGGASRAGVTPFTDFEAPFSSGASLKRYPPDTDRDDCSRDFYTSYSPSPGVVAGN
ncbi:MAG TPA: DUF11 domain-containing protein [Thermoflexia bacterium]|nr:DUF11 domain-containing protein [Thermoflexia bacterium]